MSSISPKVSFRRADSISRNTMEREHSLEQQEKEPIGVLALSEPYKYQLSPAFSVDKCDESRYCLLVRMRVRLTDEQDKVLGKQKGLSRRKHLCRNWWNDDWLHRVMAVMQFLSSDDERIVIREDNACLEFASTADYWEVGKRLDESVLNNVDEAREDALTYADDDTIDEGKDGD